MWSLSFCLALSLPVAPRAASQRQRQPPGCRERCGNVIVIGAGCHRSAAAGGLRLRCDGAIRPPRLTVSSYGHEVAAVSLPTAESHRAPERQPRVLRLPRQPGRARRQPPGAPHGDQRQRVPLLVDEEQIRVRRLPRPGLLQRRPRVLRHGLHVRVQALRTRAAGVVPGRRRLLPEQHPTAAAAVVRRRRR
jgi:hypothetical protein